MNEKMTLPADRQPDLKPEVTDTLGWDPYEVWRTRILLPRLEAQNRNQTGSVQASRERNIVSINLTREPQRRPQR